MPNKTCVINDPLGQNHCLASSEHYFLLNLEFEKCTDGRTDNTCENNDHYRSWLWVGSVEQLRQLQKVIITPCYKGLVCPKVYIKPVNKIVWLFQRTVPGEGEKQIVVHIHVQGPIGRRGGGGKKNLFLFYYIRTKFSRGGSIKFFVRGGIPPSLCTRMVVQKENVEVEENMHQVEEG